MATNGESIHGPLGSKEQEEYQKAHDYKPGKHYVFLRAAVGAEWHYIVLKIATMTEASIARCVAILFATYATRNLRSMRFENSGAVKKRPG